MSAKDRNAAVERKLAELIPPLEAYDPPFKRPADASEPGPGWTYAGERVIGNAPGYEHRWFRDEGDTRIVAHVTTEVRGLSEAEALELWRSYHRAGLK